MSYVVRIIIQKHVHLVTYVITHCYLFTACTVWKAWHPGSATKALACRRVSSGSQREKICTTLTNQRNKAGERTKLQEIHNFVQLLLWFWRHFWEHEPLATKSAYVRILWCKADTNKIYTYSSTKTGIFAFCAMSRLPGRYPKSSGAGGREVFWEDTFNLMKNEWFWVLTL